MRERAQLLLRGDLEGGVVEADRARGGGRRGDADGLQGDVVVRRAEGEEGHVVTQAFGDAQAEQVAVEGERAVEIAHFQVNMADFHGGGVLGA